MRTLKTERLILRNWQKNDLYDLYEHAKNPNIGPNAGWRPHGNMLDSIKTLDSFILYGENWAIQHTDDKKVIGIFGLHKDPRRDKVKARKIGYSLNEEYWGHGLATEAVRAVLDYAFDYMSLDLVSVYHFPHNDRSRKVIEHCGFKFDGVLRQASKLYDGRVMDEFCYSLLRNEYFIIRSLESRHTAT